MSQPIKLGKLIYHLTDIRNLDNIFKLGLMARRYIKGFVDVADEEILADRSKKNLDQFVPFHFFNKNPFDGRVIKKNPDSNFVYLTMQRTIARENNFLILPKHPLSKDSDIELLPYDLGFSSINWELMETREFSDQECKLTCMAECLSPKTVTLDLIHCIYTKSDVDKKTVEAIQKKHPNVYTKYIDVNEHLFVKP